MRGRLGFLAVLLGVLCIILAGILAAVHWIGTDEGLYFELQTKAGILDAAGISEEDLGVLDAALADCLKGNPNAFYAETDGDSARRMMEVEVFGQVQPAFNDRELTHMEDCRQLFILLRRVRNGLAAAGAALLVLGGLLCRDCRQIRQAAWIAPVVLLIPLGMFAVWAAIDFHAAFDFFHKMLFTNDLWLLNPATDLLIRICPSSMFMSMGVRIGLTGLLWAAIVPLLMTVAAALKKERIENGI